ncbi:MAG TPA: nucleotidyltransferase domain-containing protein [Thermoleophilia bacterium]|nr:nucleotidyltransferase domain-containing protein [Thermoleophilia bacterium]
MADLLGSLFRSRTRARILALLFADPQREWHIRGLAREVGDSAGNVRRELLRLAGAGYLTRRSQANLVLYKLDQSHPLYPELRALVSKTVGAEKLVGEALAGVAGVRLAFLYGSYAAAAEHPGSDLDVMVVGRPEGRDVHRALRPVEDELRREVNYVLLDEDELGRRWRENDGFLRDVLAGPVRVVVGSADDLKALTGAEALTGGKAPTDGKAPRGGGPEAGVQAPAGECADTPGEGQTRDKPGDRQGADA